MVILEKEVIGAVTLFTYKLTNKSLPLRIIASILFLLFSIGSFSQKPAKAILDSVDGNSYYSLSDASNKRLLVFLHGGVNNPYFNQAPDKITVNYLLEGNLSFINQAQLRGFDMVLPITNSAFNWLEKPQESFVILESIIENSGVEYDEIYISGFSDGGTGSYKIFYLHPNFFNGLVMFNGYPQHANFYQSVNYESVKHRKVLFFGTYDDKIIPYEFLLTEYCGQKKTNPNTFIYLTNGAHGFANYGENDLTEVFKILTGENENTKKETLQGFIENDQLIEFYPFRKKVLRKYNFGKSTYLENIKQRDSL
jgi:predicted esterase